MSKTKHTEGPWRVNTDHENKHYHIIDYVDVYGAFVELVKTHKMVNIEQSEANAKLIAAAPSLLAALKQCVTVLNPSAIVMDSHKKMVLEDALSTIEKATDG